MLTIERLHTESMKFYKQMSVNERINLKGNYEKACGHNDEVARMSLAGIGELYAVVGVFQHPEKFYGMLH